MRELTRSEAIRLHRKMWNWIVEETLKKKEKVWKSDYFKKMGIILLENIPEVGCYCCEFTKQNLKNGDVCCNLCPLNWESEVDSFMCCNKYEDYDRKGLFKQWLNEINYKKCASLAMKIANLTEK